MAAVSVSREAFSMSDWATRRLSESIPKGQRGIPQGRKPLHIKMYDQTFKQVLVELAERRKTLKEVKE